MHMLRESRTPSVPNRSPFRIRDSQLSKMQQQNNPDRWSLSMELVNMWNMKPAVMVDTFNNTTTTTTTKYSHSNNKEQQQGNMFSSGNLLTQLLVSQAILDSNEYKILSFENLEQLKREHTELQEHIKNLSKSIELETRIKNISKSLENINLKNSRNSMIYLKQQRQHNDYKISHLSTQLEDLGQREIQMKKTLLQHTAGVLNKGIQSIELAAVMKMQALASSPLSAGATRTQSEQSVRKLEAELEQISSRVNYLYSRYCAYANHAQGGAGAIDKLTQLDQQLSRQKQQQQKSSAAKKGKREMERAQQNKARLLAIEHEKDDLLSKLVDMELKSTKLLSQLANYSNRQRALQYELLTFKGESLELKIWTQKQEKDQEIQKILDSESEKKQQQGNIPDQKALLANYKKQLTDQSTFYESNIQQQHATLEKTGRLRDKLTVENENLKAVRTGLDESVIEKSRILDNQDVQISRLQDALRALANANTPEPPKKYEPIKSEVKEAKERMKKAFLAKETQWTAHAHHQEDGFDQLLEDFDTLTHTAMDFESKRMKYDKQIEQLMTQRQTLEAELMDEKVNKIGYGGGEQGGQGAAPATTASLRKEFRSLVADLKAKHQARMEREEAEIRKLHEQLEALQSSADGSSRKSRAHSIAIQADLL